MLRQQPQQPLLRLGQVQGDPVFGVDHPPEVKDVGGSSSTGAAGRDRRSRLFTRARSTAREQGLVT